jgi:hypothetical protein
MPRTLHLLGYSKKGESSLIAGTHVPINEVRKSADNFRRTGKLPDGIIRLEVFDSERGKVGTILPHDGGAAHRAEVAKLQAQAAKTAPKEVPAEKPGKGNSTQPI